MRTEASLPRTSFSFICCLLFRRRRVLVPGCGLSRLLFEVVKRGYGGQGNEFSYQMLLVSNYMLNHVLEPESVLISFPNSRSDRNLSVDKQHEQHFREGRQQPVHSRSRRGSVQSDPAGKRLFDVRRRVSGELRKPGERMGLRADVLLHRHSARYLRVLLGFDASSVATSTWFTRFWSQEATGSIWGRFCITGSAQRTSRRRRWTSGTSRVLRFPSRRSRRRWSRRGSSSRRCIEFARRTLIICAEGGEEWCVEDRWWWRCFGEFSLWQRREGKKSNKKSHKRKKEATSSGFLCDNGKAMHCLLKKQKKETCQDDRLSNASRLGGEHPGKCSQCCHFPLFCVLQ